MEIGGFITEGAEIVNHNNSLSGNGTVDSPLRLNETVLWSGTQTGAYTFQLSETLSNFEKFRIAIGFDQGIIEYKDVAIPSGTLNALGVSVSRADSSAFWYFSYPLTFNADKTSMSIAAGKGFKCGGSNITQYYNNNTECVVYGIWGINRKA